MTLFNTTETYSIAALLEISHLADHFYAMVKGLSGRDTIYNNPGVSLRSFVVANCRQRQLALSPEMAAIADECFAFNDDPEVRRAISDAMRTKPYETLAEIVAVKKAPNTATVAARAKVILDNLCQQLDAAEALLNDYGPSQEHAVVQILIDLKTHADGLEEVLERTRSNQK